MAVSHEGNCSPLGQNCQIVEQQYCTTPESGGKCVENKQSKS